MDPASITPTGVTPTGLRQILAFVGERIAREEANLNALDAAIGDGDHGITMRIGFSAINSRIKDLPITAGIDLILRESGTAFMGGTGGAIGVLLGRMLISAGAALKERLEIGPAEFSIFLDSMETALVSAGKAKPGDKTMLDAVHAANEVVKEREKPEADLVTLLALASQAARRAAEATAKMPARMGRASKLGARALSHPDPGGVSFSIILEAMADWTRAYLQARTAAPG